MKSKKDKTIILHYKNYNPCGSNSDKIAKILIVWAQTSQ